MSDIEQLVRETGLEVIPDRLFFLSLGSHPKATDSMQFFTIDYDLTYQGYFADFGPLNAAQLVKFCRALRVELDRATQEDRAIVFYCSHSPHNRANAGYLLGAFCLLILQMSVDDTWDLVNKSYPRFLPFRDASYGLATFSLTIFDCLSGLSKAVSLGWFNVESFNVAEYEQFDQVDNGDWNWIIPGRMIAFSSPVDSMPTRHPKKVIPAFRERGVQTVVRLNDQLYDRRSFQEVGMRHVEMVYPDGSTPCDTLANQFIELCEKEKGAIAVHCKAGLGRTGTMIGLYTMKHFGFSAKEFIAWSRICRPGCVIGCQQQYLVQMERRLNEAGDAHRSRSLKMPSQMVEYQAALSETQRSSSFSSTLNTTTGGGGKQSSTTAGPLPFLSPNQKQKEMKRAAQCALSGERYLSTAERLSTMRYDTSRMANVKVKLFNPPTSSPSSTARTANDSRHQTTSGGSRHALTTPALAAAQSRSSSRSADTGTASQAPKPKSFAPRIPVGSIGRPQSFDDMGTHVCGLDAPAPSSVMGDL